MSSLTLLFVLFSSSISTQDTWAKTPDEESLSKRDRYVEQFKSGKSDATLSIVSL